MIKNRLKKYLRLLQYFLSLGKIKRTISEPNIQKVGVLVTINPSSNKFKNWHDGFTEALKKLGKDYDVTLIFFDEKSPSKVLNQLNQHDFIIVKSAWRSAIDYFLRIHHKEINPVLGLMISASNHGPSKKEQEFYEIVWYETEWYKRQSIHHANAHHAFGIDTEVMKPTSENISKVYDIIAVGAPRKYKRLEKLLNKSGKRLLVGDLKNMDRRSNQLIKTLKQDGVIVEDFQDYETLSRKYQVSRVCYIPCKLHGGGERSLLEARACGLGVEIESDNPKLTELLNSPIWDADYYYKQLKKGIESVKK